MSRRREVGELNIYVLRVTMLSPSRGVRHQSKLDAVFDLLDGQGLAEDVSTLDESGRFSLWLDVAANTPQEALTRALEAVERADSSTGGERLGSIIGVDIQVEEGPSAPDADPSKPGSAHAVG